MSRLFSFASWNVEHFRNDRSRVERVLDFVARADPDGGGAPDIFALYEVEGVQVFEEIMARMREHSFFITEAEITQNILVGVRNTVQGFVTQREALQSGVPTLRPGALATLQVNGEMFSLLFLHMKANDEPRSWGLRDDMTHHIQGLKRALDRRAAGDQGANFLVLGDINNVGMNLTFSDTKDFTGDEELARYSSRFSRRRLRLLPKSAPFTFSNGSMGSSPPSDLDHVYASNHLQFRQFTGGAEVLVRGWPEFDEQDDQDEFIRDFSDHALLYGEVHG